MIASAPVDLEALIKIELPPLPGVAMRVASLTQDLDATTRKIADAIGCDPILAARVLRAANSPLYCFERSVTALSVAVSALGNENIYSLVFISAAADAFLKSSRSPYEKVLWEHSIAVGLAAREIMLVLRLRGMEEGFLCGLLHDFGKLLLLRHNQAAYSQLRNETNEDDLLAGEMALFGYTHAQVGAMAARRWNLPEEIAHAIYYHHNPGQANHGTLMARVVDVADALAYRAGFGTLTSDRDVEHSESAMALNLTSEQLQGVLEKTQSGIGELSSMVL